MADNLQTTQTAAGATLATDDIAGVHYPRTKIVIGDDGVNGGDVSATNPLPVVAAAIPLPAGASTETTLAAAKAVLDSLLIAAQAIQAAADALNTKTTAVNTGAIVGAVIADTGLAQPLTEAQLRATPVEVQMTSPLTLSPSASYGTGTSHHKICASGTNATSVKAGAGCIASLILTNIAASWRFFKLYDKAGAPVVGTDTPIATIGIPPGQTLSLSMGAYTKRLALGIAYAVTGGIYVPDTTAIGGGEVAVSMSYTG